MNCTIQINKLLNSKKNNPLEAELVENWLKENWDLYIKTVDNNSCSNRQSPFPCFCCIRKDDCLFCDIYKELSIVENFNNLNAKCLIELENLRAIKNDNSKINVWLKKNINLGLNELNDISELNSIRRSFINGKNNITKEFDYIIIYISTKKIKNCFEFKNLFDHLFFEKQILKEEYINYINQLEEIETN